ncbi:MAG: AAA family ATPase [Candidatus Tectomicrobia bacterium]|nr:AAA family ATPase [Candidatus Tectomicrobia bacterium]
MKQKLNFPEVPIEKLRWRCQPDELNFTTTDDVLACEGIIGQDKAIKAIRLGLEIDSTGYNIFVTGLVGTGRTTSIKCLLEEIERGGRIPPDICYVNNFKNPDMPRVIFLPSGKGAAFKRDMDMLIASLKKNIPLIFESEHYQTKRNEILQIYQEKEREIVRDFEKRVAQEGFTLIQIQMGPYTRPEIVPVIGGNPVNFPQLETLVNSGQLSQEKYEQLRTKYLELVSELEKVFKETRSIEREVREKFGTLDREAVLPLVDDLTSDIRERYEHEPVNAYLGEVEEQLIADLDRFRERGEPAPSPIPGMTLPPTVDPFLEYQVNVIVDHSESKAAPIITETFPSYKNLFGTIERVMDRSGQWRTDFTKIKAGSLLRANGGYLIINATDALLEPAVWPALKRTLKYRTVEIQSYDPFYMVTISALKPEPIEINTKVIMIGDTMIYQLLYDLDDDFKKVFKVKADFDTVMDKRTENVVQYASFIRKICLDEGLKPFEKSGVAAVVEYGVRLAGKQTKLSTKFNQITDLIREADYWARKENSDHVIEAHVEKAISERVNRSNLIEEKIQEMMTEGTIMIDTEGLKVGQVNGLSVYDLGDYAFGKPSRITAQTAMGKAGIINIEREADLSGKTHNKGMLILGGYLRGKYAQDKPLTMSASICFEQSYSGVDGDSASSTEIYALLSSLSGLPLRQDIAVTGSVNQKGEIQPIGGVNEKIEGFFDVCRAKGLTGTQGVIIPALNVADLMLKKEVVEAVKEGKFHIYPVNTIDEGIEILTEIEAGTRKDDGAYEEGTVNFFVDRRLRDLAEQMREFEGGEETSDE